MKILLVSAALAFAMVGHKAPVQPISSFSSPMFNQRIAGHPKPLGLSGIQQVPAGKYNRTATTAALNYKPNKPGNQGRLSPADTVLVLYDSTGPYAWLGQLYSQQIENLLSHFSVTVKRIPVEQYQSGQMNAATATFYLGVLYDNPLPTSFTTDAMTTDKPLCWMGYNLWKIAWNKDYSWNTSFINRFGMTFYYMDSLGYPTVQYKGQNLQKLQYETTQGRVEITDASICKRIATSTRPDGLSIGYITKGRNLFYVADNPFSYTTFNDHNDRVLAFEDVMHDVLGSTAGEDHRAILRIEDVHPNVDPALLTKIADTLAAENVPFVVCVIPWFYDPLGNEYPKGTLTKAASTPAFVNALKYMESKGGKVIMHGFTHQYSNVANPYYGESADDFEFFRVTTDANGNQVYQGPVFEDSSAWAAGRLNQGMAELKAAGFNNVTGWVTPHYMASPVDYVEFQKMFQFSVCRGLTFAQAADGTLRYSQQHSPWVYTDNFGMKRIPETIGYMDTDVYQGIPAHLPADLIRYATANKVVRDGFAGMYFHWYLDPALLKTLVQGIKGLGYRYVMPDASLK